MKSLILAILLALLSPLALAATQVNGITWSAPTVDANGSALPAGSITGYEISIDGAVVATVPATQTSWAFPQDSTGAYTIASGTHTASIITDTDWASSTTAPINFIVVVPGAAGNVVVHKITPP